MEVQAVDEQEAKEYVAENILNFIEWADVTVEEIEEEKT
jgi:hypothetical protein